MNLDWLGLLSSKWGRSFKVVPAIVLHTSTIPFFLFPFFIEWPLPAGRGQCENWFNNAGINIFMMVLPILKPSEKVFCAQHARHLSSITVQHWSSSVMWMLCDMFMHCSALTNHIFTSPTVAKQSPHCDWLNFAWTLVNLLICVVVSVCAGWMASTWCLGVWRKAWTWWGGWRPLVPGPDGPPSGS